MKAANLAVRFLLELCLLAALAYDGLQVNVVLAVGAGSVLVGVVFGVLVALNLALVLFWHQDGTVT